MSAAQQPQQLVTCLLTRWVCDVTVLERERVHDEREIVSSSANLAQQEGDEGGAGQMLTRAEATREILKLKDEVSARLYCLYECQGVIIEILPKTSLKC